MCQNVVLEESCRILSGFPKILIGKTIVKSRCLLDNHHRAAIGPGERLSCDTAVLLSSKSVNANGDGMVSYRSLEECNNSSLRKINVFRDTKNVQRDTKYVLGDTRNVLRDTKYVLRDTRNVLRDTKYVLRDTNLVFILHFAVKAKLIH